MDKSQIKRDYKETKRPMGIYAIKVSQKNTVFLGVAIDLDARINRHKSELKFGGHRNSELQKLWDSQGEAALTFEILDVLDHQDNEPTDPKKELQTLAEMWTHKLKEAGNTVISL